MKPNAVTWLVGSVAIACFAALLLLVTSVAKAAVPVQPITFMHYPGQWLYVPAPTQVWRCTASPIGQPANPGCTLLGNVAIGNPSSLTCDMPWLDGSGCYATTFGAPFPPSEWGGSSPPPPSPAASGPMSEATGQDIFKALRVFLVIGLVALTFLGYSIGARDA
jgi:hypothetical protein